MAYPGACYWSHNGLHQHLVEPLNELVPAEGPVLRPRTNKALEKFRKASNCYYDLFNNGLCNRAREFYHVFGIASSHYRYGYQYGSFSDRLYQLVEEKMDEIIFAAAQEQLVEKVS